MNQGRRRRSGRLQLPGGDDGAPDADYAVCTIPATVLNDIPNNFSMATQDAIADTPYDSAVKLAFQAKSRFWEDMRNIYGGISWTNFGGDRDVTQIWYPSNGYHQVTRGSYWELTYSVCPVSINLLP